MSEATGEPAGTIHSALGYHEENGEPVSSGTGCLEGSLFLVDEASMIDLSLLHLLLRAIPDGAKAVLIGDPDQLPSVGAGNVLGDIIASGAVPAVKLDVIYRQGQDSPIIAAADAVNHGQHEIGFRPDSALQFIPARTDADTFRAACSLYRKAAAAHGVENVILLNPYRERGELSVVNFNKALHPAINPPKEDGPCMNVLGREYRPGDYVMQMKNTDSVKNGDTGFIRNILDVSDPDDPEETTQIADIEWNGEGRISHYDAVQMRDVDLAYCTTIHKSQGSEYHTVILVVSPSHQRLLSRRTVYTGITRAREEALLTGSPDALLTAIDKADDGNHRFTLLRERLQNTD